MRILIVYRRTEQELRLAARYREFARSYQWQASGYAIRGVQAPAVADDLLDVWTRANDLDGGTQWPA